MPLLAPLIGFGLGLCAVTPADDVALGEDVVHLSDAITLDCLPEADQARMGQHILISRRSRDDVTLSRAALSRLARRRVPMLELGGAADGEVRFSFPARETTAPRACVHATRVIAGGEAIDAASTAPMACPDRPPQAPVRYDPASGATRALVDIPAGEPLGALYVAPESVTNAGDQLTLIITAGPVLIERPVEALQSSRPGERIFVRDADGQVLSAPLAETHQ